MRLLWVAWTIALFALIVVSLSARAAAISVESYCLEGDCPVDDYNLTGFKQTEANVVFSYYQQGSPFNHNLGPAVEAWGTATASGTNTSLAASGGLPASSICGNYGAPVPAGYDGLNSIVWGPLDGLAIGRACWSGQDECDIVLDSTWPGFANEEATRTVALHEVGHCLGLSHSAVTAAVMYASYSAPKELHADDLAGFCAVYGCGVEATPTSSPTATKTPTPMPTPVPTWRCGERVWTVPVVCKFTGVSRDAQ